MPVSRIFFQMCQKQCRDENGFKCHLTSDSHLRNMRVFRDNAGGMMDSFSREFETAYLETLRRRHGTQRMNANNVYQEVIQDKGHIHMNATKWATLTHFVQYLGKKGVCVVEETERGWYVTYIERDPALLERKEKLKLKLEADAREEKRAEKERATLRVEAARALDRAGCSVDREASEIGEREGGDKLEVKLGGSSGASSNAAGKKKKARKLTLLEEEDDEEDLGNAAERGPPSSDDVPKSAAQMPSTGKHESKPPVKRPVPPPNNGGQSQPSKKKSKKSSDRKDHWLHRNTIVRIISKSLSGGDYYKKKAVVTKVIDRYTARLEVLDTEDVIEMDQDDLETVIPKSVGEKVRVVNGRHRGAKGRVESLDKRECRGQIRLSGSEESGAVVELDYEDFCKIA